MDLLTIRKQTIFELRVVLVFLCAALFFLGSYTQKKYDENLSLRSSLNLLEVSLEQQRQQNELRLDSLQQRINLQDRMHLQLLDTLASLESERLHLNTRSDENKAAITRLGDVDSLYGLVARHYH